LTSARRLAAAIAVSSLMLGLGTPAQAQDAKLPVVTLGAGMRTSFAHTEFDEDVAESTDRFLLDSARLYVGGSVTDKIKLMFNTEYNGGSNEVGIMDAAARLEFSNAFNIWAGRFLPPSDRSNLYGPYYAHHWNVFTDAVQDGYPFIFQGRANGVMYWGQFDKIKVSGGVFDGPSLAVGGAGDNVLGAARVQVDFWDSEDGYYLNSTYYGAKNLLAVGVAGQAQGEDNTAYSVDFLLERKAGMGGAFTVEAEWARYTRLGGYPNPVGLPYDTNDGGYVLGAYLFPTMSGPGRFEVLGKYAHARFLGEFPDEKQKTSEINLNYLLKEFNARLMMFFIDTRYDVAESDNFWKIGAGLQIQM
jgi:hypothetical protein